MRENRQSGSEGGARLNPFVPTPIAYSNPSGLLCTSVAATATPKAKAVLHTALQKLRQNE